MNLDWTFSLQLWQWSLVSLSGVFVGLTKTGLSGLGLIFVPVMAFAFGAKASTGILLPMLNMGDVFGVAYYRRHAETKQLVRLLPWSVLGLASGVTFGANLPDAEFKKMLGILVLVLVGLMIWQDSRKDKDAVPTAWWFHALAGTAAGFTTMVGNAAGPVMSLYLISMRMPKNAFIGTSAWFFLIINLIKVPLQVVFWHNISAGTLAVDLAALPFIALGAWAGLKLVGKIPERLFKILVLVMTGLSAVALLVS